MSNSDLASQLRKAAEIISSAELPEMLQPIAFGKVVDVLLATPKADETSSSGFIDDADTNRHDWTMVFQRAMGISAEQLHNVYTRDEAGFPLVSVDPTQLGKNTAECTRKVALLVAGARQIGNLETATDSAEIIQACRRLGVHDSSNFSTTLGNMASWFHIIGTGRSRSIGIKPSGRNALRELLRSLGS